MLQGIFSASISHLPPSKHLQSGIEHSNVGHLKCMKWYFQLKELLDDPFQTTRPISNHLLRGASTAGPFFTNFLEDLVGPTLRQAEFFVLSFEFFSYSEFFWTEDTK